MLYCLFLYKDPLLPRPRLAAARAGLGVAKERLRAMALQAFVKEAVHRLDPVDEAVRCEAASARLGPGLGRHVAHVMRGDPTQRVLRDACAQRRLCLGDHLIWRRIFDH